ncbi:flagellar export protein FliJ [Woeseia oceani]|uniref:Flagellar FliJ protein n=1 Tax=Woeseia oceani TaxID=1548547 RepID=A0A193LEU4_9GAMM|nr:flagellar export protein FliJ [Woeseia oceani]ANO51050.1 flagellar export protein FliJ [Woeseia oceani]
MNDKADRIQRVQHLAETEERKFCRAMGEAQRLLGDNEKRLQELQEYRREYASRRPNGVKGTISSVQWADYQNFLHRLDEAVRAQQELVMNSKQNRDAHRKRWMLKRQKMESLQKVVDRYRTDAVREDERQEQKVQDDLPARAHLFSRATR